MSEDERGLDGWHVCGLNGLPLNREQLFYSKDPVVKLSDTEYINIQNASRLGWTPDMWSAHKEVGFRATSTSAPRKKAADSI